MRKLKVFVCTPLNAPTQEKIEENIRFAERCGDVARAFGMQPIIPHQLARFFDDNDPEDRAIGISKSMLKLKESDILIAYRGRVTTGMSGEIAECERLGIPVHYFDDVDELIEVMYNIYEGLEDDE
jgi:hypothetical protein